MIPLRAYMRKPMTTNFEQIQIDRATIGRALSEKRLRVDTHQREYSWEEEHVHDLYQDFADVMEGDGGPSAEHFLGSIVVTRDQNNRQKIVDGQQRLATCLIFIAAIRDYLYTHDDERKRAESFENIYLITTDPDTLEPEPHLQLNGTDNAFFSKTILARPDDPDRGTQPEKPSHKRLVAASRIAAEWVKREAARARPGQAYSRLKPWKDFKSLGPWTLR
jgi:hypothetical protein